MTESSRPRPTPGFPAVTLVPVLAFLGTLSGCPGAASASEAPACATGETAVVVLAKAHVLVLCEGGAERGRWNVALGSGGVDKRREGDARTPLGRYSLGTPRPSAAFHRFIPVAYPTLSQARAGRTGSAVGIHGPPRGFQHLGLASVAVDWTLGCIALPSDADVDAVGAFVRENHAGLRVEP